jgi:hypothetical protein
MKQLDFFFNFLNPSSRNLTLGLTQHLTELSTIVMGSKARQSLKAGNLIFIWELIV